jgi:hypothetical protein
MRPFPPCPRCGDELSSWALLFWDGISPEPSLATCVAEGFYCYACGYDSQASRVGRVHTIQVEVIRNDAYF